MLDRHAPAVSATRHATATAHAPRVDPEAQAARSRIREYYLDEIVAWRTGARGQNAPPPEREKHVARLYQELLVLHEGAAGNELDDHVDGMMADVPMADGRHYSTFEP